jgi:methionyl-tRNA synthetase
MSRYYLTTPIYYVNDVPHIGSAYTTIAADIVARFHRLRGEEVLFATGTDENAPKVLQAAQERDTPVAEYVDRVSQHFRVAWERLNISYDVFIRTTEERHVRAVQTLFRTLQQRGDIYKGEYEGWYCLSDETFFSDEEVIREERDGETVVLCPNAECRRPVQRVKEENYFFALSRYGDRLLQHIEAHPEFLQPEFRRNEVLAFIREGLRDVAITRSAYGWGIPVPDDPAQVVYVWFDALINYLTITGYPDDTAGVAKWWPADLHLVGKDIYVRFHCTLWPAMLMAAGLPVPRQVFGHGFWNVEGQKMSKTRGNVIEPLRICEDLAQESGAAPAVAVDAVRYFLFREVPFGVDGDFAREALLRRFDADLANDLGNALNRALPFVHRNLGGSLPGPSADAPLEASAAAAVREVEAALERLDFMGALLETWKLVGAVNKFVEEQAPWNIAKVGDMERLGQVLYNALEATRIVSVLVSPFMPSVAAEMQRQLGLPADASRDWASARQWGGLQAGWRPAEPRPIFPRIQRKKQAQGAARPAPLTAAPAATAPSAKPAAADGTITIDEFVKVELRVVKVLAAERVAGADKLLQLRVDLGTEERTVLAGIAQFYEPSSLVGRSVILVANLAPRRIRGVTSHGMILAADAEETGGGVALLSPDQELPPGSRVR